MSRRTPLALIASLALASAAITGCTKDSGSVEAFCDQVGKVPSLESVLSRFSETERDVLDERIEKARVAYHDLADDAPPSISGETDDVVDLVDEILDSVEQNPEDPEKAADQLRSAMADHEDASSARATVAGYAQDNCGVQLDPTLTESTTTAPSPTPDDTTTTTP